MEKRSSFVLTPRELRQLAKYWATVGIDNCIATKNFRDADNASFKLDQIVNRRLKSIALVLGDKAIEAALLEARSQAFINILQKGYLD